MRLTQLELGLFGRGLGDVSKAGQASTVGVGVDVDVYSVTTSS